jgi:hypothetical protein
MLFGDYSLLHRVQSTASCLARLQFSGHSKIKISRRLQTQREQWDFYIAQLQNVGQPGNAENLGGQDTPF